MRIGQVCWQGRPTAAVFERNYVRPIPGYTLREMVDACEREGVSLTEMAQSHGSRVHEHAETALPVEAREIWACGRTYTPAAEMAARPEIFFKGTARVSVGPGAKIGIRADSSSTVPEAELALLLGSKGKLLGYTLANDVTAADIQREGPLFQAQAKIFTGCCALGPWFVTPDELTDPYALSLSLTLRRGTATLFEGATPTSRLNRRIEHLIAFLLRSNPVPGCSVLLTGTGVSVPAEAALEPGDVVRIECAALGVLENEAAQVS